jgi:NADH-quinone oxidoreductase subunit J
MLGAEFLAMILVVVYVGAVAVLFLFVVMMLDVDFVELRQGFLQYLPVGRWSVWSFLVELVLVVGTWVNESGELKAVEAPAGADALTNTEAIGQCFIRPISLLPALGPRAAGRDDRRHCADAAAQAEGVKRQDIGEQVARNGSPIPSRS